MRISASGKTLSGLRSTITRDKHGWIILIDCGNQKVAGVRVPKRCLAAIRNFDRLQREAIEEATNGNA